MLNKGVVMKNQNFQRKSQKHQKGVGMLEVLIALLVLSIGILGLATLQSIGLKYNHHSYQRTQAILQIYDMVDRIRSTNSNGKATQYEAFALAPPADPTGASVSPDCTVSICDQADRAAFDIERWRQSLVRYLGPGAQGGVTRVAGTRIHRFQVDWMENDVIKSFVYEAQLI
jgi:type IV pilus assembly protein PilV